MTADAPPAPLPSVMSGRVRWYALFTLVLLAASLPEFLTGSTKILAAVANPLSFAFLMCLYGGGALLIREASVRWGKRWAAVLLLGGAYAIGEEGFAAKTMTDPMRSNVGNQLYTHWAGLNWVPVSGFTVFHAVFSIALMILLMELIFPQTKGRRLLGRVGVGITMVLYALTVLLLSLADPFTPPLAVTLFLAGLAIAYIAAAYYSPSSWFQASGERPDRRERSFVLLGLGFMGGFFLVFLFGPLLFPWPVTAGLFVPLAILTAWYLVKHAGRHGNDRPKVAFLLGVVLGFVPVDVVSELNGAVGVLGVTGFTLALLLWIRNRRLIQERLDLPGEPGADPHLAGAELGPPQ